MALKVTADENFELNENIPGQIEEAINNGWKNFTILPNGQVVNADFHMKVTLGKITLGTCHMMPGTTSAA